jgi:PAS domain S-box-containing protein
MAPDHNKNLFFSVFQQANEACLIVSAADMVIRNINQKACRLIGRNHEDLINTPLSGIECALQDIFFWDELNADANRTTRTRVIESEWLTASGQALPIQKRVSAFNSSESFYWIIYAEDITERKKIAQDQLYLSSQLQSSLEATAEGILSIDLQGKLVNINRRFIQMCSLTDELIVEGSEHSIMQHIGFQLTDRAPLNSALNKIQQDQESEMEVTLALQDGRHLVLSSKPEYLRDRLIGRVFSVRDISAMKKVEQDLINALAIAEQAVLDKSIMLDALKMSESRLRRLINSSLIGICQGDMNGHLTLVNDALIQLIGSSHTEIINNRVEWIKFTPVEFQAAHKAAMENLKQSGHTAPFYSELLHRDGHSIPVMVGLAQLEGSEFEWVGFVLDLTEQKKADKVKSEFISVVSHELRTPITSIRGAMGILDSGAAGQLEPKAKQLVEIAHRNSQRLLLLVNDILDMEKLISGKMNFKSEAFDLCELAKQAIEANSSYASALGVRYELNLQTSIKSAIGDPERTMQVFANLLSNAAKFSPKDEPVKISILATNKFLRVEVKDKGPGIPEEFRSRIFSKFAQADGSNTRQQGGTGLGLSITKSIIEKMSGEIGFETELGKGTSFWFSLPRAPEKT